MVFREKMTIEESLKVYIKYPDGHIEERWVKKPWSKMNLLEKILHVTHIKRQPGTMHNYGLECIARLYANDGNQRPVTNVLASTDAGSPPSSFGESKTGTVTYVATGKVNVTNEDDPFPGGSNYYNVGVNNVSDGGSFHNYIGVTIELGGNPDVDWWVEIEFTFS